MMMGAESRAGATLLDALDTLWIMDMKQEFARGRDWVANDLNLDLCASHGFFLLVRSYMTQIPLSCL